MKINPITFVALSALVSVASATVLSSSSVPALVPNSARDLQADSDSYSIGTPVSWFDELDGVWYDGTIVNIEDGNYFVHWDGEEEGQSEQFEPGLELDQMVQSANEDDDSPPDWYNPSDEEMNPSGLEDNMDPLFLDSTSAPFEEISPDYAIGTPVSFYEEDQWLDGEITGYSNGKYTITWSDGLVDTYEDEGEDREVLNQMVEDASGDDDGAPPEESYEDFLFPDEQTIPPTEVTTEKVTDPLEFPLGTAVSFFEEGEWFDGEITDFNDGKYTITWSDGLVDTYFDQGEDLEELKQMVDDASGDDDAPPADYPSADESFDEDNTNESADEDNADETVNEDNADETVDEDNADENADEENTDESLDEDVSPTDIVLGTPVSVFEDGAWIDGEITDYSEGLYTVVWNDDYVDEYVDSGEDLEALEQAIIDYLADDDAPPLGYDDIHSWEFGTPVSINEDGTTWYGHIDDYDNGEYYIVWDNGDTEWIAEPEILDQMVQDAKALPKQKTGMATFGKVALALLAATVVIVGSVIGVRFFKNQRVKEMRRRDMKREAQSGNYRDDVPIRGEANYYRKQKKKSKNLQIV